MVSQKPAGAAIDRGFTLIEILVSLAVVAVLVTLAIPSYTNYVNRARGAAAAQEMRVVEQAINAYQADRGVFPPSLSLSDIGQQVPLNDPWGRPYEYHIIGTAGYTPYEFLFTDSNLDYDLYSKGADMATDKNLGPPIADNCKDDIIRASNGGFLGLATAL
jgi:general secretion pathway protein G